MIATLRGTVQSMINEGVILDVNGVGYEVNPGAFNAAVIASESPSSSSDRTAATEFSPMRAEAPAVKIQ